MGSYWLIDILLAGGLNTQLMYKLWSYVSYHHGWS